MSLLLLFLFLIPNMFLNNVSGQKINFTVPASISDNIFIYYFYGPTMENNTTLKLEDGLNLTSQPYFDVNSNSIFIFHGYGDKVTKGAVKAIASALLEAEIRNVIAFDYDNLVEYETYSAATDYVISVYNASRIGQAIGEFFKAYIPTYQSEHLMKMVSHSLGAQIMSKTARVYGAGRLPHLTGLDPAGPYYNIIGVKHLDKNDAIFVDVIHTDGEFYGDGRTIGTVDFFPNRGTRLQPGCNDIFKPFSICSHKKAYEFYAESILNPKIFLAKQCSRTPLFTYCCCDENSLAYMGYFVNTSIEGTFFLNTNAEPPYGKGEDGINF